MTPDHVGAPDPTLRNSPIYEIDEPPELPSELENAGVCYFNDREYPEGSKIISGESLLRCDHGVWMAVDPADRP